MPLLQRLAVKMPAWERLLPALGLVVSALGYAVIFPPVNWGGLAWLFLVPGLWWAARRPDLRSFVQLQFLGGLLAWCFLVIWVRNAHPAAWFGVPALAAVLALFWTAWWAAAHRIVPLITGGGLWQRFVAVLGLAGGWVVLEWMRSWFLTGFPWLPLAASQWQRPIMLQPAAWIGAWGMSGVIVLTNLVIFSWLWRVVHFSRDGWKRLCPEFHVVVLAGVVILVGGFRSMTLAREIPLVRVGVVQPDIPQNEKWDPEEAQRILDRLSLVHLAASATKPDLVLWPEAVLPYALRRDPFLSEWTRDLATQGGAPVLLGTIDVEPTEEVDVFLWRNAAAVVEPQAGFTGELYVKRKLVPFGEYVPLRSWFPNVAKLVPIGGDFEAGAGAAPLQVPLEDGRRLRAGVLICYEDLFPRLSRATVLEGAEVLVVLTNNGWFGREAFATQHAAHSVLRAIETRRPVVRCGNAGWSGWIDAHGRIRGELRESGTGTVYFRGAGAFDVGVNPDWVGHASGYVRYGDRVVPVGAGLFLLAWLVVRRRGG